MQAALVGQGVDGVATQGDRRPGPVVGVVGEGHDRREAVVATGQLEQDQVAGAPALGGQGRSEGQGRGRAQAGGHAQGAEGAEAAEQGTSVQGRHR